MSVQTSLAPLASSWRDVVDRTVVPPTEAVAIAVAIKAVTDYESASEAAATEAAVKAVADYEASEQKRQKEFREKKIHNICELISYSTSLPEDESESIIALQNELEKELLKD